MDSIATFDIMPTGCRDINLQKYMDGASINLSYKPQNVNLLNLIGIEAECVSGMNVKTNFTENVTLAPSAIYCSNVRGKC